MNIFYQQQLKQTSYTYFYKITQTFKSREKNKNPNNEKNSHKIKQ